MERVGSGDMEMDLLTCELSILDHLGLKFLLKFILDLGRSSLTKQSQLKVLLLAAGAV